MKRNGFSLVEVVVATVLLAVSALGLAAYSGTTLQHIFLSNQLSVATVVAREQADSLRALPFDSVAVGQSGFSGKYDRFNFSITRTVEQPSSRLKTVRIRVFDPSGRIVEDFRVGLYLSLK